MHALMSHYSQILSFTAFENTYPIWKCSRCKFQLAYHIKIELYDQSFDILGLFFT